jgi:fatty acid amide hydrolase 2
MVSLKKFACVGRCISSIYFFLVFRFFSFINLFKRKSRVSRIENEILLQSATALAFRIRQRELTSEAVVKAFIERCKEVDQVLNAIVQENYENALKEARKVDEMIVNGSAPNSDEAPFLGVPFTLKDCIFVDGLICTAGIPNRRHKRMFEDADVVRNMKQAGGIVLAVTNVSEVCMWWEANNTIYGRTKNPYDTRRIVGGSSGGEGALLTSAGSVIGIGSDIGGSIRMPAYFNGIFGHKTTGNVLSDKGCYPETHDYQKTMCVAGPMCRFADDLIPMLTVLAGPNAKMMTLDKKVDFSKLRIFYMDEICSSTLPRVDRELKGAVRNVIKYFGTKYDVLSFKLDLTLFHYAFNIWTAGMDSPTSPSFAQEMTDHQGEISPLVEFCKWIVGQSPHTFPAIGLAGLEMAIKGFVNQDELRALTHMREQLSRQFESLLGDNGVFLFAPHPTLTPYHNQPCWTPFNWIYTGVFNALALPVTSVPMGLSREGTPLAVQVVGASNRDHLTIAVAQELEKAFGGWVQPGRRV